MRKSSRPIPAGTTAWAWPAWIAFRLLGIGPGDEVIVQGNTYIASVMGITINGATPVFVEPDAYYNIDASKIEEKITERTKAVLVVHLYGQASNMAAVKALTDKYHLKLVEDCAQSHGACFDGQMTGTFGDVGCFSFYPSKNIGAFGDGGGVVVKDEGLAQDFRVFRNYGSEKRYYNKVVGANSRLDELQAGLLRVRLRHVQECEEERCQIAARYLQEIRNPKLTLPGVRKGATAVWHQFVVRCENQWPQEELRRILWQYGEERYAPQIAAAAVWHQFVVRCEKRDELKEYLEKKEIGTIIHYPIPPHLSEAYQYLGYQEGAFPITEQYAKEVLSLPMYNGMTEEEQTYVIEALNAF